MDARGVTRDLSDKFMQLRAEAKPKVDFFAYGLSKEFYLSLSVYKAKLEVGGTAAAAATPSPYDELQKVPERCMTCGSWFGVFSRPRLCPCCKRIVVCSSCIGKIPTKIRTTKNGLVPVKVCEKCAVAINTLEERDALRALRESENDYNDPMLSAWMVVLTVMDMGNKRLKKLANASESARWSNSPEIKVAN